MLLGTYSVLTRNSGRFLGGVAHSAYRPNFNSSASNRNRFFSTASWNLKAAQPNGNLPPRAWVLPQVSGGMSSYTYVSGFGALTSSVAGGINAVADLAGSGALTATGALIVSLVAALGGSGVISDADVRAFLNATATLSGSGALISAVSAYGELGASLAGIGAIINTIRADGFMSADIIIGATDPLSPENLAAAVWNALAVEFNNTGSFGELVQNNVGVDYDRIMREVRDALVAHIWAAS